MHHQRITYNQYQLDTCSPQRQQSEYIENQLHHPDCQIVFLYQQQLLLSCTSPSPKEHQLLRLSYKNLQKIPLSQKTPEQLIYLGKEQPPHHTATDNSSNTTTPLFALALNLEDKISIISSITSSITGITATTNQSNKSPIWSELRTCVHQLSEHDSSIASLCISYNHWHNSHRYCPQCATALKTQRGGSSRYCTHCDNEHFPRINPAVIMLIENLTAEEPQCLLANSHRIPSNTYSTIAGYLDIGESLEQAVIREVAEEVGLKVNHVEYISSQTWSFSQSIMVGFFAQTNDFNIQLDKEELLKARWFKHSELQTIAKNDPTTASIKLSRPDSIARFLINHWLQRHAQ